MVSERRRAGRGYDSCEPVGIGRRENSGLSSARPHLIVIAAAHGRNSCNGSHVATSGGRSPAART
ncbi:hypothetical protein [Actinacidiphila glaucinigra]